MECKSPLKPIALRQTVTIVLFLLTTTLTAWGQVRVVGKIYVNGREYEVIGHRPPYFEFNPFDTTLTKSTLEYLDDFGKSYKDSLLIKHKFLIELTPGLTSEEQKRDKELGTKRLMGVIRYLEKHYGINKSEFKARYSEVVTSDGCVGFLDMEKKLKK